MIDELLATRSGYFYKIQRPISKKAVAALFRAARAGKSSLSQNHFQHVREVEANATWSAISFTYERAPAFLVESTLVRERIAGFMMLVEYEDHLCIFKSQLEVSPAFVSDHLERVDAASIDAALTSDLSVFERLRLRNMTTSKLALRSKTLEADNLENSVGPASASRFAPLGYTVRTDDEHFSTTPRTGRITQRSDRESHLQLIEYACEVIDRMTAGGNPPASFLHSFARSLELSAANSRPVLLSIDVATLRAAIFDDRAIRFVRLVNGVWRELPRAEVEPIIAELDAALLVDGPGKLMQLLRPTDRVQVGAVSINKNRIALRSLNLPLSLEVQVENTMALVGQDTDRTSLREYLDQTDAFLVLFDRPELAYIGGRLYRDEAMTNGGQTFLRYLIEEPTLTLVTSEKGSFAVGQTEFDRDSTFGVVIRASSTGDDVLVCDDLGDEWADFIGLCTAAGSTRITFYHAKHGELSMGASPFHVSVSQAIKNLGRLGLQAESMTAKFKGWRATYNNDRVQTAIPKVCRGDPPSLEASFAECREAPGTARRVAIVTSSLSKAAVTTAFNNIQAGQWPDPHFVQLYWLLASFFSACAEVSAFGYVVCQP